jgi:hypothetical protein
VPSGNLAVLSSDNAEERAKRFPQLGKWAPFTTQAGREFIKNYILMTKPEVVFLDNLMSLAPGNHRETEVWQECLPLVHWLHAQGIAQVWLDHTGLNGGRQYGDSSKRWIMDAVGVLVGDGKEQSRDDQLQAQLRAGRGRQGAQSLRR